MAHKFDMEKVEVLDAPGRREFLDPEVVLDKLKLGRGSVFVDVGAGTGYFSLPASKRVQQVYALDILDEMLDILKGRIVSLGITNIRPLKSQESGLPLPDDTADTVFMANVFHELDDHRLVLEEIRWVLKHGGTLAILDWKKEETPMGPPVEHRFSRDQVVEILRTCGFELVSKDDAGPYNYLVRFIVK